MIVPTAAALAVLLAQALADPETWLRAARDMPAENDAAQEHAALERMAAGFQMKDVRITPAAAHGGAAHERLAAHGASVRCHDVEARGSLIDVAYFVPAVSRLARPSLLESLELTPTAAGDLAVSMRVAFPSMEVTAASASRAVRVLDLVRDQPRPIAALLGVARRIADAPVRLTRVRQADAFELDAVAAGARAAGILAAALEPSGVGNARVSREPRGGCTSLRVSGKAASATRDEEDAARGDLASLHPFLFFDPRCETAPAATVVTARRTGGDTNGVFLKARGATRGEAIALLEIATGRPLAGFGPDTARIDIDLAAVPAADALAALREGGAPLRPFGGFQLWTGAAGPFRAEDYTGAPVTLSFECAELGDLLRVFGEISGLEIRPGDGVAGCVDVAATDRPWDEAFEAILAAAGLQRRIEGTTVVVSRAPGGAAAEAAPHRWRVPLDQLGAGDLRLVGLARSEGQWRAFVRGPLPGRLEVTPGARLADGVVRAVDESGVTIDTAGRAVRLTLP